jgi:hypothetical protein
MRVAESGSCTRGSSVTTATAGGDCFANHSDEVPHVGFAAQLELRVVERLADHPLEHGRANVSSITAP